MMYEGITTTITTTTTTINIRTYFYMMDTHLMNFSKGKQEVKHKER